MESFVAAVEVLKSGGPWAVIVVLAWAYMQKDKQNQALVLRIMQLVEANTSANTRLETAIGGLKEFITAFIKPSSNQ